MLDLSVIHEKIRYSKIFEEEYNVNMFSIFKRYAWPSMQSGLDGTVQSLNGFSSQARYGWRRWEQYCVAYDMINGKVYSNVNGDKDGASTHNAKNMFLDPLEKANSKIKNPDTITDLLFGCQITEDTAGKY